MFLCILILFTPFLSILCVSQEKLAYNQQIYERKDTVESKFISVNYSFNVIQIIPVST